MTGTLTATLKLNSCALFCNPKVWLRHRESLCSPLAPGLVGPETPCEGRSFDGGNNRLSGLACRSVEIAQGAERVDQPVVVVGFPDTRIDSHLRHRRGIEAPVQLSLEARRLESGRDLGDLCRREIARRPIALVLANFGSAEHRLPERAGCRLERAAQQVVEAVPRLVERDAVAGGPGRGRCPPPRRRTLRQLLQHRVTDTRIG